MQACTACGAILVGDLLNGTQGLIRGSKGLPLDANLARVPIRDIFHKELQISRNNGCDLVKILPDLGVSFEWLQIDHVMVCSIMFCLRDRASQVLAL